MYMYVCVHEFMIFCLFPLVSPPLKRFLFIFGRHTDILVLIVFFTNRLFLEDSSIISHARKQIVCK